MKESTTWQTEEQKKEHLRFVDEVLTNYFGRSITNNDALATAVYKATDCGARGKVDENGDIVFHTIVEGSNVEISRTVTTAGKTEDQLSDEIDAALDEIEFDAEVAWEEAHPEEE